MERLIEKELKQWKEKKDRKVLLLRGARQVGKTYSIRKLSKSFKKFLEINFEETPAACRFFENSLTPHEICERLAVYFNTTITPGEPRQSGRDIRWPGITCEPSAAYAA